MPAFRERIAGLLASASSAGVSLRVNGDSQDRVAIEAGGRITWGSGAAASDLNLQRGDVSLARLTGSFVVNNNASGDANSGLRLVSSVATTHTNWRIGAQMIVSGLEFTPSTAVGGTTFSTPSMVILNNGNVGIGNANPTQRLRVEGNIDLPQGNFITWNNGDARITAVSGYHLTFSTYDGAATTEKLRVQSNGNVGIGTTSPSENLTVYSNANSRAKVKILNDGTGASARSEFVVNAYGNSWGIGMGSAANNSNSFYIREDSNVADTQRFTIAVGGNVGIGLTSPTERLHVSGNVLISGSLSATTKSFDIDHPTKPGQRLRYGSVEAPEHSVQVRGRSTSKEIYLPGYWLGLVDPETITVQITPVGCDQKLFIEHYDATIIAVGVEDGIDVDYFYTVSAERIDIPKLTVEYGDNV